eukprot:SAG31_NODE_27164_length_430_cov_0.984894_2_plen_84_part_01
MNPRVQYNSGGGLLARGSARCQQRTLHRREGSARSASGTVVARGVLQGDTFSISVSLFMRFCIRNRESPYHVERQRRCAAVVRQ